MVMPEGMILTFFNSEELLMPTPTVINQWRYSDAINRRSWDNRYFFDDFSTMPVYAGNTGTGLPTGTAGDLNTLQTGFSNFQWNVIGTQTLLTPTWSSTAGINLAQDQTAAEGMELSAGFSTLTDFQYTVGTDNAFFLKGQFKTDDVSGCNPLIIGFRKLAAFNATLSNYTDFVSIGLVGTADPNTIKIQTQLATGGVTTTDTTQTLADNTLVTFEINVSSAGVVTYKINGSAPTVTAAFTFASGTIVVQFVRLVQAADIAPNVNCNYLECGFQS